MIRKKILLVLVSLVVLAFALPCLADTVTYEYDDLYRLIRATYSDGTVIEYTYDAAGNRITKSVQFADSDSDGLPDALEATTCTDPQDPDTDNDGLQDGAEDANANGLVDAGETDPCNADTEGDGMPDGWEVQYGLDPLDPNDAAGDLDGDGLTNLEEYNQGTDPTVVDAVEVSISADPATIQEGESSTLTWTSANATTCTIDQGIGPVDLSGSTTVSPTETTTYTITAEGAGGTATDSCTVTVAAEGGQLGVTVQKAPGEPLGGIHTYLFTASGSYLGLSQVTDANGAVAFEVAEGAYKVRADYLGYQFWSDEAQVTGTTEITLTIPHQAVEITVQGSFQGANEPFEGVSVYLFTAAGSYLNQNLQTDANGKVSFDLPEQSYKVRADYLDQQYWSGEFVWQDTVVSIPMADAEITVTGGGLPQEGVKVYVFSASGSYLGLNQFTDVDSKVSFHLPATTYKFRVDYQGSQYWSAEETFTPDQINPISISVEE
jgi:YD repeat-containing protein